MDNSEKQFIDQLIADRGATRAALLEILHGIQARFGYLRLDILEAVCERTEITPADITGVSTFYDIFRHSPAGKYTINVCVGTACHVKGAQGVYDAFRRRLNIPDDGDTDADRLFTVARVACLGCCTLAPAVQIEQVTYGHVSPDGVDQVISNFLDFQKHRKTQPREKSGPSVSGHHQGQVRIGLGSCCVARGSETIRRALMDVLDRTGIRVEIKSVGCVGMCSQTPLLEIVLPDGRDFLYTQVRPDDVKGIMLRHFKASGPVRRLLNKTSLLLDKMLTDSLGTPIRRYPIDQRDPVIADFLNNQKHIATENCGVTDPTDIDEYRASGGFAALEKALKNLSPDRIIEAIEISGLRGRGGAGYPTHLKWRAVAAQAGEKFIVCNGDEGDPGAFMDRMLMESYPFRVIEGMCIAAFAVGARRGWFYIRAEYPLAIRRITEAIEKCRDVGLLGRDILGTGFGLEINITPGAGAFVCGEETALLASIEGRRGMPALRPPYPAQKGLWQKPTLINNVETYANIAWILRNGAVNFAGLGSPASKGTKVFALAGKVERGGLIEVPMGITLRKIVEEVGGGIANGLAFKAVQVGGPSGGCIPAALADTRVDYESLTSAGAIMGSGGLVVLDETDCMVDIARYFLQFTQDQSCGKCTFCRVGTLRMLEILERLCRGEGKAGDIEQLEELAAAIKDSSLCGLGKTAPNPVLSTLEHFRDEYQAHIAGRCPAKKCRALIHFRINEDCIGCTLCAQHCPTDAIAPRPYEDHEIDQEKCIRCGTCKTVCPENAVDILTGDE